MKCPICTQNTPDNWRTAVFSEPWGAAQSLSVAPPEPIPGSMVAIDYMYCANDECKQLVIRVHETVLIPAHAVEDPEALTRTWLARPRSIVRAIDPLVLEPFKTDYLEAAAILDASPRMSAVLSRSVLGDLLQKYAGLDDFGLNDRIKKFRANEKYPSHLRTGIQHFREIGDFGAHTQKNDQAQIIPVTREDAEWMLDFIDRVFDYFIVTPQKDLQILDKWDKNIADAGRKPIPPLSDEPEDA
jgi:hypothetical protein